MFLKNIDPTVYDWNNEIRNKILKKEQEDEFDYFTKYYELHSNFIQPTNIKINIPLFLEEIKKYHTLFRQWGENRNHLPRYGISLINYDGIIDNEYDIGCSPLDQYNENYRFRYNIKNQEILHENDFIKKTEVYKNLSSLRPLDYFENLLIRSNILLWHKTASFVPHLDTWPKKGSNYRLWGISGTEKDYTFAYLNKKVTNIEPGRIYLIDTTQWHYAVAHSNYVYTFFLALQGNYECYNLLKKCLL